MGLSNIIFLHVGLESLPGSFAQISNRNFKDLVKTVRPFLQNCEEFFIGGLTVVGFQLLLMAVYFLKIMADKSHPSIHNYITPFSCHNLLLFESSRRALLLPCLDCL